MNSVFSDVVRIVKKRFLAFIKKRFYLSFSAHLDQLTALVVNIANLVIIHRFVNKILEKPDDIVMVEFGLRVQPERSCIVIVFKYGKTGNGLQIQAAIIEDIVDLCCSCPDLNHLFMSHETVHPIHRSMKGEVAHCGDGQTDQRQDQQQKLQRY